MEDVLHLSGQLHSVPCASMQQESCQTSRHRSRWQRKLAFPENRKSKEFSLPFFTSLQGHWVGGGGGWWWWRKQLIDISSWFGMGENQSANSVTRLSAYTQVKHAHTGACASVSFSCLWFPTLSSTHSSAAGKFPASSCKSRFLKTPSVCPQQQQWEQKFLYSLYMCLLLFPRRP